MRKEVMRGNPIALTFASGIDPDRKLWREQPLLLRAFFAMPLVALLLSACSSTPSSTEGHDYLLGTGSGYDTSKVPQNLRKFLIAISDKKNEYWSKLPVKRWEQTAFDSSLIGVASATVSAAFFGASSGAIGGLGIGAGTISAYRSYYNPEGERSVYAKGYFALDCLEYSSNPLLFAQPDDLKAARDTLAHAIANAKVASAALAASADIVATGTVGSPQNGEPKTGADVTVAPKNIATGLDAAADSISAAEAALRALDAEIAAYTLAPYTVAKAFNSVVAEVDHLTARSQVDISATQASLTASITSATTAAAATAEARAKLAQAQKSTATEKGQVPDAGTITPTATTPAPALQTSVQNQRKTTVSYVAGLNEATEAALNTVPVPAYTAVVANITACSLNG